jgi:hypothetical protein
MSNFNTPFSAFLSVFIVLANDGWSKIYYDHYRVADPVSTTLFFFSLLVVGQFILVNLFIAILIENFNQLSIRNDMINKIENMRQKPLKDKILSILTCRNKKKILPQSSNLVDDLLNDEL